MASSSPIDRILILLVLLLLPLNLFSFAYRPLRRTHGRGARFFRPAIISALLISLSTILALSEREPSPLSKHRSSDLEEMKVQITNLEFLLEEKNVLLNSRIVEIERSKKMVEEMDEKIEFLQKAVNDVKVSYNGPLVSDEKIKAMSDEVQQLWDESRRNNFNIHVSESKTLEAEKRVEELASKVEQMQNIINDQWIQIQQLEQSLQMPEVMASRVKNKLSSDGYKKWKSINCLMSRMQSIINEQWIQIQQLEQSLQMSKVMASRVLNKLSSDGYKKWKSINCLMSRMQNIINEQWIQIQQLEQSLQMSKVMASRVLNKLSSDGYKKWKSINCLMSRLRRSIARHAHSKPVGLPNSFFLGGSISRSSLYIANNRFKGMISATRKKHHELQYILKQAMEMNEYTAPLAHREFVFFMASAIIVFPLMMVWVLCSSFVD